MKKILRFYNQNKKNIWKYIGAIILFIILIHILDDFYEGNAKKENNNENTNTINETNNKEGNYTQNNTSNKKGIDLFLAYCDNDEYEKAYEMLSNETKEKKEYKTESEFTNNFVNDFLNVGEKYTKQQIGYSNNLYVIESNTANVLETGNANNVSIKYIAYSEDKIEIKDYIQTKELSGSATQDNINFKVKRVTTYYNYVEYKVFVVNNTQNSYSLNNILSTYLQLENATVNGEILNSNTTISPNTSNTVNVRFNIKYNQINSVEKICFKLANNTVEIEM